MVYYSRALTSCQYTTSTRCVAAHSIFDIIDHSNTKSLFRTENNARVRVLSMCVLCVTRVPWKFLSAGRKRLEVRTNPIQLLPTMPRNLSPQRAVDYHQSSRPSSLHTDFCYNVFDSPKILIITINNSTINSYCYLISHTIFPF